MPYDTYLEHLNPQVREWLDQFLARLSVGRAPHTLSTYKASILRFLQYVGVNNLDLANLPPDAFDGWAAERLHTGIRVRTCQLDMVAVHGFIEFLHTSGYITGAVPLTPIFPRELAHPRSVLSDGALVEFLRRVSADAQEPYRTMLLLLPLTGLRRTEMIDLRLNNVLVSPDGWAFKFVGKGSKERVVPLGGTARGILVAYVRGTYRSRYPMESESWLFPAPRGRKCSGRTLFAKLQPVVASMGLKLNLHELRHTYATRLLRAGVDFRTIQELLGHSRIQTTGIYTHVDSTHLRAAATALDRYAPAGGGG